MRSIAKAKDHFGIGRDTTEDVHRIHDELGLYLVCDGSRDPDGLWAAETLCERVSRDLKAHAATLESYRAHPSKEGRSQIERLLQGAVQAACAEVFRLSQSGGGKRGPTSTALGAVLCVGDVAFSAHVGNTRLYLVRAGKALRLTRDHTYYEEMVRSLPAGSPVNPAFRKRLTRAIGDSESVPLSSAQVVLQPGDRLVLCSNGLSDHFSADAHELESLSATDAGANLPNRLVDWALAQKSDDNITAMVIELISDATSTQTPRPAVQAPAIPIARDAAKQLELLRGLSVFKGIRSDERALLKIQGILTFRQAKKDDVIVQQGSPSDEMFVLIRGTTEVRGADGKRLAVRGPGEVIGEMGFFDGRLRSATIVALEPVELMSIQRWEFDALVQQDWRLGYKVLEAVVIALAGKLEESSAARAAHKAN